MLNPQMMHMLRGYLEDEKKRNDDDIPRQHYLLINLDKKQQLPAVRLDRKPIRFLTGNKLREILFNEGIKPSLSLLLSGLNFSSHAKKDMPLVGSWAGDRVLLIGDLSNEYPFLTEEDRTALSSLEAPTPAASSSSSSAEPESQPKPLNLYTLAHSKFKEVELDSLFDGLDHFEEVTKQHHIIVNTDKHEYLDPEAFKQETAVDSFGTDQHGCISALIALISYSNKTGWGDLRTAKPGSWAGDHITIAERSILTSTPLDVIWTDISQRELENIAAEEDFGPKYGKSESSGIAQ